MSNRPKTHWAWLLVYGGALAAGACSQRAPEGEPSQRALTQSGQQSVQESRAIEQEMPTAQGPVHASNPLLPMPSGTGLSIFQGQVLWNTGANRRLNVSAMGQLRAQDGSAGDWFGLSLALQGSSAVIGSPQDDEQGVNSGSAWVYLRQQGGWTPGQKLFAQPGGVDHQFGASVALFGGTLLIGAPGLYDNQYPDPVFGTVAYLYTYDGWQWNALTTLRGTDSWWHGKLFGWSVALRSEMALVGAPADREKGELAGAVYVFSPGPLGWQQRQKLTASDAGSNQLFGYALALDTDTLAVGTSSSGFGASPNAVYVFSWQGSAWVQKQKLMPGVPTDGFGEALAIRGDELAVGAPGDRHQGEEAGAVYLYHREPGGWQGPSKLLASSGVAGDKFGASVALDTAGHLAVGAPGRAGSEVRSGGVYLYLRQSSWVEQRPVVVASDGQVLDGFGTKVAIGSGTLLVGAPFQDGAGVNAGATYVYGLQEVSSGMIHWH